MDGATLKFMSTWCHIPEGQNLDVDVHRYTSGITVLSACEKVADKIKTCMKKASGHQQLCAHYWAVVIGNPQPNSAFVKVGLTFKENPCASNDKQVCVYLSNAGIATGGIAAV